MMAGHVAQRTPKLVKLAYVPQEERKGAGDFDEREELDLMADSRAQGWKLEAPECAPEVKQIPDEEKK